jgi:CHAT domain-containing protein/tetratricopeptide (TPR) repeat protein
MAFSWPPRCGNVRASLWLLLSCGLIGSTVVFEGAAAIAVPMPMARAQSTATLVDEGNEAYAAGEFRRAAKIYLRAIAQVQQTGDRFQAAGLLTRLGWTYARLAQYQKALETLEAARLAHLDIINRAGQQTTATSVTEFFASRQRLRDSLDGLGFVQAQLGQYTQAMELYQAALNMSRRGPTDYEQDGYLFNQIGAVHLKLGQPQPAMAYYQQSLVLIDTVGYVFGKDGKNRPPAPSDIHRALYQWQDQRRDFSRIEQSLRVNYDDPLKLHPWARILLVSTLNHIGQAYQAVGMNSRANQIYFNALKAAQLSGNTSWQGISSFNIGEIERVQEDWDAAKAAYESALSIGKSSGDRALQGQAYDGLGQIALAIRNPAAATTAFTAAMQAWEDLRPGLSDANRISLFDHQMQTYTRLQTALVQEQKPEQALAIAERGRARAFVELLARRQQDPGQSGPATLPPPTLDQIRRVAQQQNTTLVEYSVITADDTETTLYIWVVKPTGAIAWRQIDLPATLRGTSLASYISRARLDGLGVRGRGATAKRSGNPTPARTSSGTTGEPIVLASALPNSAVDPASDPVADQPGAIAALQNLHLLLIQPIADLLPTDANARVTFIPQGNLFLVPFAALQDPQGKFLVEQHTIAVAPSIQVLDLVHAQAAKTHAQTAASHRFRTAGPALIVGNPTMPKVRTQAGDRAEQLGSLPGAETEARAIAKILNAQPLIGAAATKAAVLEQMPQARLIHLATHGLMDDFRGLGVPGAIALAPSGQDSGLLTADEILGLRLRADLVVLSACDTGRGRITGDGVIGLSRSLISAGVPSVIVSLWAVPDAPTAFLMQQFYENLQGQPDNAIALRQAMLTTLQQYPAPRDWAPFTLIGE